MTGANTEYQTLMGMGAGVSTEDVCTFRHNAEGTGLELWHGSFGWFDFVRYAGAPIILTDTWGIQIERPSKVLPSGGQQYATLQQATSRNEDDKFRMPDAPIVAGTWTAQVQGDYIVIKNKYASRQTIVLLDDGFIFLGSRGTSLRVTRGEQAEEVTLEDALALLPGLALK